MHTSRRSIVRSSDRVARTALSKRTRAQQRSRARLEALLVAQITCAAELPGGWCCSRRWRSGSEWVHRSTAAEVPHAHVSSGARADDRLRAGVHSCVPLRTCCCRSSRHSSLCTQLAPASSARCSRRQASGSRCATQDVARSCFASAPLDLYRMLAHLGAGRAHSGGEGVQRRRARDAGRRRAAVCPAAAHSGQRSAAAHGRGKGLGGRVLQPGHGVRVTSSHLPHAGRRDQHAADAPGGGPGAPHARPPVVRRCCPRDSEQEPLLSAHSSALRLRLRPLVIPWCTQPLVLCRLLQLVWWFTEVSLEGEDGATLTGAQGERCPPRLASSSRSGGALTLPWATHQCRARGGAAVLLPAAGGVPGGQHHPGRRAALCLRGEEPPGRGAAVCVEFCVGLDTLAGPEPSYRAYQMSHSTKAREQKHMHGCSGALPTVAPECEVPRSCVCTRGAARDSSAGAAAKQAPCVCFPSPQVLLRETKDQNPAKLCVLRSCNALLKRLSKAQDLKVRLRGAGARSGRPGKRVGRACRRMSACSDCVGVHLQRRCVAASSSSSRASTPWPTSRASTCTAR